MVAFFTATVEVLSIFQLLFFFVYFVMRFGVKYSLKVYNLNIKPFENIVNDGYYTL